jgi:hypothetical protein
VDCAVLRVIVRLWPFRRHAKLFAAKKHFTNGKRRPLHRKLGVNRPEKIGKGVVDTDDFLPLGYD